DVHVQLFTLNVNARPDDLAGPADTAQRAATIREIHRGLSMAVCALPAIDEMRGRSSAADEEDPDIVVAMRGAPAAIVHRAFHRLPERGVHAARDEAVEPGTFVHFVEMHERLAAEQDAPAVA